MYGQHLREAPSNSLAGVWPELIEECIPGNPYQQSNHRDISPSNSLAGVWPELIEEWVECVDEPTITPTLIRYSSQYMVRWNSNQCNHDPWIAMPTSRTVMRSGCPTCNESHGERLVREYLENRNIPFERERRFPDCRDQRPLPFDFADPSQQCQWIIEYHGIQHFEQEHHRGGQAGYDLLVQHDAIKSEWANENSNFLMIRYDDEDIEQIMDIFFHNLGII